VIHVRYVLNIFGERMVVIQMHEKTKWLRNEMKNRVFTVLAAITILLSIGTVLSVFLSKPAIVRDKINPNPSVSGCALFDGKILDMNFPALRSGLLGMTFAIDSDKSKMQDGILSILLTDSIGNTVSSKEITYSDLQKKGSFSLYFPKIISSANAGYHVQMTTRGIDMSHAIVFRGAGKTEGAAVNLNGNPANSIAYSLVYEVVYPYYNYRYAFDLILLAGLFAVLTVVSYGRNTLEAADPAIAP